MQVIISTRGMTVSKTYKDAVTRKLAKLERLLPKIVEVKIVLSKEKHRRTAGLTLIAKHRTFRSEETADDLAAAVDTAVEALQRQVREIKDRVKKHQPRRESAPEPARSLEPAAGPERGVVVRQVTPKPMSVEEAVEQFHLGREQFLVFTNALTDAVNVLYRRRDGGLGLIEPVA
jgi:putative sigma-54 modulation protein